jgi:hypothetical protein
MLGGRRHLEVYFAEPVILNLKTKGTLVTTVKRFYIFHYLSIIILDSN